MFWNCINSACIGLPNAQLGDWLCAKCEKTKKVSVLKAKRPTSGGMEKEETRMK